MTEARNLRLTIYLKRFKKTNNKVQNVLSYRGINKTEAREILSDYAASDSKGSNLKKFELKLV